MLFKQVTVKHTWDVTVGAAQEEAAGAKNLRKNWNWTAFGIER